MKKIGEGKEEKEGTREEEESKRKKICGVE